ncbi:hypothetical protein JCM8547_009182 [Rhodosporidiobolus lusitaniae]
MSRLPTFLNPLTGEPAFRSPTPDQIVSLWRHTTPNDILYCVPVSPSLPFSQFESLIAALSSQIASSSPPSVVQATHLFFAAQLAPNSRLRRNWPEFFLLPMKKAVEEEAVRTHPHEPSDYYRAILESEGSMEVVENAQEAMCRLVSWAKEKSAEGGFRLHGFKRIWEFILNWPSPLGPGPLLGRIRQTEDNLRPEELERHAISRRMQLMHGTDGKAFAEEAAAAREAERSERR